MKASILLLLVALIPSDGFGQRSKSKPRSVKVHYVQKPQTVSNEFLQRLASEEAEQAKRDEEAFVMFPNMPSKFILENSTDNDIILRMQYSVPIVGLRKQTIDGIIYGWYLTHRRDGDGKTEAFRRTVQEVEQYINNININ